MAQAIVRRADAFLIHVRTHTVAAALVIAEPALKMDLKDRRSLYRL
jgi:hypothetical protein